MKQVWFISVKSRLKSVWRKKRLSLRVSKVSYPFIYYLWRTLFIPFVLLVTTFGYGQISRGTIFLGGSVNVAFDQVDSDKPDDLVSASDLKRFSTTIQPYVGIFLSEKWQIGGGLAFNYSATKYKLFSVCWRWTLQAWWSGENTHLFNRFICHVISAWRKNYFYSNVGY